MAKGSHSARAQRVDHGGDFIQLPRPMLRSAAFLSLSRRARCALLVLVERFSGFNNGRIGLAIDDLGGALGNQNHRANSRALAELIERGFVECMADANHVKSKAREYRLTFIESGHGGKDRATNEWRDWTPPTLPCPVAGSEQMPHQSGNMEKIGPEATATREWKPVEATATQWKLSTEATATRETETCGFGGGFRVEATAAHIISQYRPLAGDVSDHGNSFKSPDELRAALNRLVAAGEATATALAMAVNMPVGTMSKFRNGRGLPEAYHAGLHLELGRRGAFALPNVAPGNGETEASQERSVAPIPFPYWREGSRLVILPDIVGHRDDRLARPFWRQLLGAGPATPQLAA